MIWNEDAILGLISTALEHPSSMLDAEQTVRGIDSFTANLLRDRISESLAAAGIYAVPEERYADGHYIQQRNYGERCGWLPLGVPSEQDYADSCRAGYWLEIKRVAQFLESGPHWWYEHAVLQVIPEDIYKLAKDSEICGCAFDPLCCHSGVRTSRPERMETARDCERMPDWRSAYTPFLHC
jgi:hypothetical protein